MESLAPHRTLGVDENDVLIDHLAESKTGYDVQHDFATMILGISTHPASSRPTGRTASPSPHSPLWPGDLICAEGRYVEGDADTGAERRAGIFIGPEFGTVSRPDLVEAGREAAEADFDALIACAFSYEAHATEFSKLGRIPILKARMNADLHMAGDLKNTGKGNLFVIFGEPDIEIIPDQDNGTSAGQIQVNVNGVDVFHPNTGEIRSEGPNGIACWFVETDYNEESCVCQSALRRRRIGGHGATGKVGDGARRAQHQHTGVIRDQVQARKLLALPPADQRSRGRHLKAPDCQPSRASQQPSYSAT